MTKLSDKKSIIFDLGNVVLDIDLNITYKRFRELGFSENNGFINKYNQVGFFNDFEEGRINAQQFIHEVKNRMDRKVKDAEVVNAWNALLLDYEEDRIETILKLKKTHRVYLLSNTNELHVQNCESRVPLVGSLENLFHKVYYSYQMNMSKPDANIFLALLKDAGIKPEETLFLDDSPANIKAAESLGIESWLIEDPNAWVPKINQLLEKTLA